MRDGHRPLLVRATLQDGIIRATDYSIDFAGLLHSRYRLATGRTVGDESMVDDPAVYTLPLARCTSPEGWLWCASAEIIDRDHAIDSRTFHRSDDVGWSMRHSQRPIPQSVHPMAGPFRDTMMPAPAAVVHEVQWRCVGDAAEIRRALKTVGHVGKRRTSGEGKVLSWTVEEVDDVDDVLRWSFIAGDRIVRPCLPVLATEIPHTQAWHSARPPSWNPESMMRLAISHVDNTRSV